MKQTSVCAALILQLIKLSPIFHPPFLPSINPLTLHYTVSVQGPHQRFLLRELLRDYNPMERPVANDSQTLTVQFSFTLMQVMDVVRMHGTPLSHISAILQLHNTSKKKSYAHFHIFKSILITCPYCRYI